MARKNNILEIGSKQIFWKLGRKKYFGNWAEKILCNWVEKIFFEICSEKYFGN